MIRNLTIITVVGLILALVGIGGAFAIGGNDLARHGWTWIVDETDGHVTVRRSTTTEITQAADVTKTLAWDPSERLVLDLPADLIFVQGAEAGVVLTGPQSAIDRVRVSNGRIVMDEDDGSERGYVRWTQSGIHAWSEDDRLKITVTAPSVTSFSIVGSSDLSIREYNQPTLALNISGSGDVEIEGTTRTFTAEITGSGDTDADRLDVTDATVDISGSGDVRFGPTGDVRVDISGSGDIDLTRRPAQLRQELSGSGDVEES
jgi:hypothetical protein